MLSIVRLEKQVDDLKPEISTRSSMSWVGINIELFADDTNGGSGPSGSGNAGSSQGVNGNAGSGSAANADVGASSAGGAEASNGTAVAGTGGYAGGITGARSWA